MWYVLQVSTGSELQFCSQLQKLGYPAIVPRENCMLRRGGQWVLEEQVLFTSYVFVNLTFNADNYYRVKEVPGYIKFLGNGSNAVPLSYLEVEYIKLLSLKSETIEPSKVEYLKDGSVKIISGILLDFPYPSIKFDKHKRKATVMVNLKGIAEKVTLSILPINDTNQEQQTEETE